MVHSVQLLRDTQQHEATHVAGAPVTEAFRVRAAALHNSTRHAQLAKDRAVDKHHANILQVLPAFAKNVGLPKFAQQNLQRGGNRLPARLTNSFGIVRWPKLQGRLKSRSEADPARFTTHVVLEQGTTKICIKCGEPNHAVGGSRVFHCWDCGHEGGRDLDASCKIGRADLVVCEQAWDHVVADTARYHHQIQRYVRVIVTL
jgi:hypothetical protein